MTTCRRKQQAGIALIEFALWATLLILLGVGAVGFGFAAQASIIVADAAHAGAAYGANSEYNATNTAGIQQAALNAAGGIPNLTATASTWCTCSGGPLVACTTSCGSSADLKYFVQVNTSATFNNFFPYGGLPKTFTLNSVACMPVE